MVQFKCIVFKFYIFIYIISAEDLTTDSIFTVASRITNSSDVQRHDNNKTSSLSEQRNESQSIILRSPQIEDPHLTMIEFQGSNFIGNIFQKVLSHVTIDDSGFVSEYVPIVVTSIMWYPATPANYSRLSSFSVTSTNVDNQELWVIRTKNWAKPDLNEYLVGKLSVVKNAAYYGYNYKMVRTDNFEVLVAPYGKVAWKPMKIGGFADRHVIRRIPHGALTAFEHRISGRVDYIARMVSGQNKGIPGYLVSMNGTLGTIYVARGIEDKSNDLGQMEVLCRV